MALTKISGDVIQSGIDINIGIVTATRIDGDINGNVNSVGVSTFSTLQVGASVNISSGVVTATTFSGSLSGNATGLSGTPNITVGTIGATSLNASGVVTATTFSGNLTGNVTGNATGLSGTPNINVGTITASSATITGSVSVAGTVTYEDTTNVDSIGIITARSGIRINSGGLVVTSGVSTFTNSPVLIGSGTSTGTTSQPLQVTGGAYVSGNLGIGITNPQTSLHINGQIIGQVSSGSGILYTSYGALSSGQVANYNNNLLGYNLRGYISSLDGGASNDNFYAMNTASFGFSGIEQAYGGFINFYTSNTAYQSTTANTTVSPSLSVIISPSPSEKLDVRGSISAAGRNLNVPHIIVKDSNGRVTYFEYYFNLVKNTNAGTATQLNILSVGNLSNFHQAAFTVEYGTRIQGVSDATVSACLKQFGVNKFNAGNVAITDTNDIASDTNSNTHANITCVTNGASAYIIRGEFSSTAASSSFISGVLRGWGVSDVFNSGGVATLTFSNGPT